MRFVGTELAPRLANSLLRHFVCECGATDEDIVAEHARFTPANVMAAVVPKVA
jgi:hypothetical protein